MRTALLTLFIALSTLTANAQIIGSSWSLYGLDGTYYFDFIFDANDTLYADVGGLGILQPLATYEIDGNTITVLQSDPEDDCTTPGIYTYEIVGDSLLFTLVSDACADRIFIFTEFTWLSTISTGIGDGSTDVTIGIHPNPSTGDFRIDHAEAGAADIRIFDLAGNLVHQSKMTAMSASIDLTALPKSIYILQARGLTDTFTGRIVLH